LSAVEELLERKSSGSGIESQAWSCSTIPVYPSATGTVEPLRCGVVPVFLIAVIKELYVRRTCNWSEGVLLAAEPVCPLGAVQRMQRIRKNTTYVLSCVQRHENLWRHSSTYS
jgi:hypothetical protein